MEFLLIFYIPLIQHCFIYRQTHSYALSLDTNQKRNLLMHVEIVFTKEWNFKKPAKLHPKASGRKKSLSSDRDLTFLFNEIKVKSSKHTHTMVQVR